MDFERLNILVTGADGFIGSHLVESLLTTGARVRALCCYNSFNSYGWLENIQQPDYRLEIVSGDIRDPAFCRKICKDQQVIFHLASLIAIPYSYIAPASYIDTNVTGTLNICQAAVDCGCLRFLHTSTSEVYGSAIYVPIDEQHPLQPQSPYSASKIAADMIARSFHYTFRLPVVVVRPFNTYGPRQSARAVIPTIISQIAAGRTEIALGDITTTRDFNYVADTCQGFLELARCDRAIGETVNVGSGREISIQQTFELIRNIMGSSARLRLDPERVRPTASEVVRLVCNNKKISELTPWTSQVSLEDGLSRTVTWFSKPENLSRYKTGVYNV